MLRRLLAVLVVLVCGMAVTEAQIVPDGRRVALVIGNAGYKNTPVLANTVTDAKAIADKLRAIGFNDVDIAQDMTADALRKRLRDFAIKARLSETAVVFYAGHGLEAEGRNYLVPVDARLETDLDIDFETVELELAVKAVGGAKGLKLLILDACRDNPLAKQMKAEANKARTYAVGLAPVETKGDVLVSYSAAAGAVAEDGPPGESSPFAKALIEHMGTPGLDVRQLLGKVRDAVLAETSGRQRPFVYASLGGDTIALVPGQGTTRSVASPASPVIVDLQMADPKEEAVKAFLGDDNDQFGFGYDLRKAEGGKPASVVPSLSYFATRAERGRTLIEAPEYGYFSPQEQTVWTVSFPLLDLIARRSQDKVITLSELVVEVEQSVPDASPYVDVVSISDEFARLMLINEGWSTVSKARLEYDVVGLKKPTRAEAEKILKAKQNGGYTLVAERGAFEDYASISLEAGLARVIQDFGMLRYAFHNPPGPLAVEEKGKRRAPPPPGYAAWLKAHPIVMEPEKRGPGVWIVGRLIVESATAGVAPIIADVIAPVAIYPPDGLGGGQISYKLKDRIALRTEGERYTVRRSVGFLLDKDTTVFRGLYALTADRTSRHRLRVFLRGDGGQDLYASEWIDAHVVVPRLSKKTADWIAAGSKSGQRTFRRAP